MKNGFLAILAVGIMAGPVAANAAPIVMSGYDIQAYATGMGALAGMTIGPDGKVYVADNAGGRVLRIESDGSVTLMASGIPFPNGITFTNNGRLFVASGGGQAIYEVTGGTTSVFVSGLSFPTSVAALGNDLYASNSGNGTISRVQLDGSVSQVLAGLSAPNGPFGISFGPSGSMYFIDHATGGVYSYDFAGDPQLLANVSGFGGTFTNFGFSDQLFATDVVAGNLMLIDLNGGASVFASGFSAKVSPPAIGPNGVAYNGSVMYVGDGDTIYRITSNVPDPETLLQQLLDAVTGKGSGKSLANKIKLAQTYYAANDVQATCAVLTDFLNEVRAQAAKKKLTRQQADQFSAQATAIMTAIGCN